MTVLIGSRIYDADQVIPRLVDPDPTRGLLGECSVAIELSGLSSEDVDTFRSMMAEALDVTELGSPDRQLLPRGGPFVSIAYWHDGSLHAAMAILNDLAFEEERRGASVRLTFQFSGRPEVLA